MSTHNIGFRREMRILFAWYPLLSRPIYSLYQNVAGHSWLTLWPLSFWSRLFHLGLVKCPLLHGISISFENRTAKQCRSRWHISAVSALLTKVHVTALVCSAGMVKKMPLDQKHVLSWRLIVKYFLRLFSAFRWCKKGSCQFLVKECAQY